MGTTLNSHVKVPLWCCTHPSCTAIYMQQAGLRISKAVYKISNRGLFYIVQMACRFHSTLSHSGRTSSLPSNADPPAIYERLVSPTTLPTEYVFQAFGNLADERSLRLLRGGKLSIISRFRDA